MVAISTTLTEENQFSVAERIIAEFSGKEVNFLVQAFVLGKKEPTITKFCGRKLSGPFLLNGPRTTISFLPSYTIFWDLSNEIVTVMFDINGDIVLSRVFTKAQRSKIVKITVNPI